MLQDATLSSLRVGEDVADPLDVDDHELAGRGVEGEAREDVRRRAVHAVEVERACNRGMQPCGADCNRAVLQAVPPRARRFILVRVRGWGVWVGRVWGAPELLLCLTYSPRSMARSTQKYSVVPPRCT